MLKSVFLYAALVFGLAGCAILGFGRATEKNFRQVKPGLTIGEVINQIGDPNSRQVEKNNEVWSYNILRNTRDSADPYRLYFENGILRNIRFDSASAKSNADLNESRHKPGNDQPGYCGPIYDKDGHETSAKSCDGSAPIR